MSVTFTVQAIDEIKALTPDPGDREQLGERLRVADAATGPADPKVAFPGAVSLTDGPHGRVFAVPLGRLNALVAVAPEHPDRLVVTRVYEAKASQDSETAGNDAA